MTVPSFSTSGRGLRWGVRVSVAVAFVLTIVFAGPRALHVVRARWTTIDVKPPQGARVDLDRVGVVQLPAWLKADMLTLVALDLAPVLGRVIEMTDQVAASKVLADLRAVPWVREAALERIFPDRMLARLTLREPVGRITVGGVNQAVDAEGQCLPCPPQCDLPLLDVTRPRLGDPGQPHPDPGVRAAAAVAAEWKRDISARVPGAPPLRHVDATNLGYQRDATRWCEISVGVARPDGGIAWLDYDHPPGSEAPRVPADAKVAVLQELLAVHPGLAGVERADLRFKNRWQRWVARQEGATGQHAAAAHEDAGAARRGEAEPR